MTPSPLALLLSLAGCAGSANRVSSPEPAIEAPAAEPAPPPEPEPPAEPPPPPLPVAPDGTVAVACADAPAGMSCVPGGPAIRGSDELHGCAQPPGTPAERTNSRPAAEIWVQTFYMDQTEVTYAAYQECAKAGLCKPSHPAYNDFSRPQQPMVGLSWIYADAYCKAVGKRLPYEAEWEKAARGPDGDVYPWGNEPATCERAVVRDARGRSCGVPKAEPNPEKGRTWEVAQLPAGRYGLYDMMGNAEEYVADWFTADYNACGEDCLGVDPKGPCDGADPCPGMTERVVKGGSWYWDATHSTGYHRRAHFPNNHPYHHLGFRCAASTDQAAALVAAAVAPAEPEPAPAAEPPTANP